VCAETFYAIRKYVKKGKCVDLEKEMLKIEHAAF
jgi:hypothetical protein